MRGKRKRGEEEERGEIDYSTLVGNPIVNSILQETPPTHSSETDKKKTVT